MKRIFTLAVFYFLICNSAFGIVDNALPGAAPGAINRQYVDNLKEMEQIQKVINEAEKSPEEEQTDVTNAEEQNKDVVMEDGSVYNPKFYLSSVKIEGNNIFPPMVLEEMANKITGQEVYLEDVLDLVIDISRYFQNQGYLTCYAYLPPQEIENGNVTIQIQESPIDKVTISGNKWAKKSYLRNLMGAQLKEGEVFNAKYIQSTLRELNREDYIQGTIAISKNAETDATELELKVKDRFPLSFDIGWDNFGRDYAGRHRTSFIMGMDNLTGYGDKLYGGTILSSRSTGALAGYSIPIGKYGTRLSYDFNYSKVNLGGQYRPLGIKGDATSHLFRVTHPLYRSATAEVIGHVGFDLPSSETNIEAFDETLSKYRLRVIRMGVNSLRDDKYGRWLAGVGADIGLGGLGATKGLSHDSDKEFYKFTASVTRVHRLPLRSLGILRVAGQYTPNALFPYEQMQVGGPYSIRGYQPGQLLGDYGVAGTAEIRTPIPGLSLLPDKLKVLDERLKLAFFYDFGYVKEHKNLYDFPTNFLNSVGFGLHANVTQFLSAQIGVGFPLQRKFDENASRLYFSINSEIDKIFCRNVEKL